MMIRIDKSTQQASLVDLIGFTTNDISMDEIQEIVQYFEENYEFHIDYIRINGEDPLTPVIDASSCVDFLNELQCVGWSPRRSLWTAYLTRK